MLRKQAATKTLCRTQHLVPSPHWALGLPDRKDDEVWPWQPAEDKKFELPGEATFTDFKRFHYVPFAFNKAKDRLNVFFQRNIKKALKFIRLEKVWCHEYYTHGTKSKAISTDKYCTNEFCNLNIPNEISADFHNKKNSDYLMYSQARANEEGCEGSSSPRQWTPSSKPSSQSLAPLQSLLKWIHFFVPMHCMWLRGHLTIIWCVPAEKKKKKKVLCMLIARISTFIQCNYQVQNIFSCFSSTATDWSPEVKHSSSSFPSFSVFTGKQLHRLLLLLGDLVHRRWENL